MPIVAAIDRNEKAPIIVDEAARLGDAFGEPVHVVHVLERDEFVELEQTNVKETGEALSVDEIVDVAEGFAADAIEKTGVTAEPVGLVGDAAEEIVDYADTHDAEYVVVAGRKRSPIGKALFGSVVQTIMLEADQPVVSLRVTDES